MNNKPITKKVIIILICLGCVVFYLFSSGIIVLDHSAVYKGEIVKWKGKTYVVSGSTNYTEGKKVLAKTTDGCQVIEVEEDPTHNAIVVRSFIDNFFFVAVDYEFPEEYGWKPIDLDRSDDIDQQSNTPAEATQPDTEYSEATKSNNATEATNINEHEPITSQSSSTADTAQAST